MPKPIAFNTKKFYEAMESDLPVFLLYFNVWNKECPRAVEQFEPLVDKLEGRCIVGTVDGDPEAELDAWWRVINFPCAILYRKGKELGRMYGARRTEEYLSFFEDKLAYPPVRDVMSDTWVGIDRLGNALPTAREVGAPKDKYVAMFYFLSFGQNLEERAGMAPRKQKVHDISKTLAAHPEAMDTPDSPPWDGPYGETYHWGESLYGYYSPEDEYIIAKHAQMLVETGVDVMIYDTSNVYINPKTGRIGAYFYHTFMTIFRVFDKLRRQGRKTPQVAFLFNFWKGPIAVRQAFKDVYSRGLYRDLWFQWEGKPLVMYDPDKLTDSPEDQEIKEFFTFRRPMPDYFYGPQGPDQWAWCEIYPQHGFYSAAHPDKVEQVPVSAAQNAVLLDGEWTLGCMSQKDASGRYIARGRSYCNNTFPEEYRPELCANFKEQWKRAFELDPQIVFITGWNEWVVGRGPRFIHYSSPNVMVDQFNTEFSRDLEPSKGPIGDIAYMECIAQCRKFKGARPVPVSAQEKSICMCCGFDQWKDVGPEYLDEIGDIESRDHTGFGGLIHYTADYGRNDFVLLKTCRDDENVWFYAQTAKDIVDGEHSMELLIRAGEGGWDGFTHLISGGKLYALDADFNKTELADVQVKKCGNEMMVQAPLSALGLGGDKVTFDFKWCDNIPLGTDEFHLEFYTYGDTAPDGRFAYRYTEE